MEGVFLLVSAAVARHHLVVEVLVQLLEADDLAHFEEVHDSEDDLRTLNRVSPSPSFA